MWFVTKWQEGGLEVNTLIIFSEWFTIVYWLIKYFNIGGSKTNKYQILRNNFESLRRFHQAISRFCNLMDFLRVSTLMVSYCQSGSLLVWLGLWLSYDMTVFIIQQVFNVKLFKISAKYGLKIICIFTWCIHYD